MCKRCIRFTIIFFIAMSALTACSSEESVNTETTRVANAFSMQAVIDGYLISLPTEYGGLPGWALDSSNVTYTYGLAPNQRNTLKLFKGDNNIELTVKNETEKQLSSFAGGIITGIKVYYGSSSYVVGVNAEDSLDSLIAEYGEPIVSTEASSSWVKDGDTVTVNFVDSKINSVEILLYDDAFEE